MKLLFDIGNTVVHAAIAEDLNLRSIVSTLYRERGLGSMLNELRLTEQPTAIWAACVAAPANREALSNWAHSRFGWPVQFVESSAAVCGVRSAYGEPTRLGVDRWLAVIAAHHRAKNQGGGTACVVDAGTAITVDVVDANGQHLGGLIAPGIGTQRRNLWGDTQIRARHEPEGLDWLGRGTEEAVAYGTLHGVLGLIERVSKAIEAQHRPLHLFLTGGEAAQLLPHLRGSWMHAPNLVLEGLARVARIGHGA